MTNAEMLLVASLLLAPLTAAPAAQLVSKPPIPSSGGAYATRVLVGDIDEDGVPDALVSHVSFFGTDPLVMHGLGGSFEPGPFVPLDGDLITATTLADFDEDGHLDVIVMGGIEYPENVLLLLGDGAGGFGSPVAMNAQFLAPADAAAADLDGDGHLDLAIYDSAGPFPLNGGIVVRFGHGDGSFEPPALALSFGFEMATVPAPHLVHIGDTNGDGLPDLVFSGPNGVLLNQGGRRFALSPCDDCQSLAGDLALADVDGDGRDDVLTPTQVFLALPSGALSSPLPLTSGLVPYKVAAGDLDGDGLVDAIVGRQDHLLEFDPTSTAGDVLLLRGHGDGSFQAPVVVSHVPQPRSLVVADVDLDGRPDVVSASQVEHALTLNVLLNHTYPAGSPFLDLGGALGGSNGYPIQLASGTLIAGQPFSFRLFNGPPNGAAFHIVGLAALNAPFKGGTLIPFPHLVNGPLPLNASGNITLAANWPAGGSGLTLWVQFWMPNGGGPAGFVASSGVRAQIP